MSNPKQMAISTLIRPNYTAGSTEFTVGSKENSLILSVNKMIPPEKMAKFSAYDGISWHTVFGLTPINGWTHIAGVFNNSSLILYVNGTIDGRLDRGPPEIAGSLANVTIGAYQNTLRSNDKMTSLFSGPIVDVTVYNKAMVDQEVEEEFRNTLEVYLRFVNGQKVNLTTIVLEDSLLSADTTGKLGDDVKEVDSSPTFSENIGLTDKLSLLVNNQTVLIELQVNPVLTSVKEAYLISEDAVLELEFYNEYDVLMNELTQLDNAMQLLTKS